MKLSLKEQLLECQQALQYARMFRLMWGRLEVNSGEENWADVQQGFPTFFLTVRVACFNAMILLLFRILEAGEDKVSPYMLHMRMSKAGAIPETAEDELAEQVKKIRPLWEKAEILRHKSVAHFEPNVSQEMIYLCANFSPVEMTALIDLAAGYVASLEFHLLSIVSVDMDELDDEMTAVMQTLRVGLSN